MLTHTHLAGGIAAAAGAALLLGVPAAQLAPLVLGAAIGAGLPDVDCPHSKPAQVLAVVEGAVLGGVVGWYFGRNFLVAGAVALAGAGWGGPGLLVPAEQELSGPGVGARRGDRPPVGHHQHRGLCRR